MFVRYGLLILISCSLFACGFQLRGTGQFGLNSQRIHLVSQNPFSEFETQLKRDLELAGASLVKDNEETDIRLTILRLDIAEQGTSRDATGRANEVILRAVLDFELTNRALNEERDAESEQIRQLKVSRSYYQDFRNAASDRNLQKDTRQSLYSELSRRLMLQVARVNH